MSGTIKRLRRFAVLGGLVVAARWELPAARWTSGAKPCPVRTTCETTSSTFRRARNSNSCEAMAEAGRRKPACDNSDRLSGGGAE